MSTTPNDRKDLGDGVADEVTTKTTTKTVKTDAPATTRVVDAPTRVVTDEDHDDDGKGPVQHDVIRSGFARTALALLRILMGWWFLWAFLDKTFGLGYSTPAAKSWLNGGHPTEGFLKFGVNPNGPFSGMFKAMAGNVFVDWLFMLGLLGIGLALILGLATRFAAICGMIMVALMYLAIWPIGQSADWAASMPKEAGAKATTNPFTDDHWLEFFALLALAATYAGDTLGLGKMWRKIVGNGILR